MQQLRKSPFKPNEIEGDPQAFALRVEDTLACADALYNGRSVLISGPRGIGKSSLGSQLQTALEGDSILLKRSSIDARFPKHLAVFHACSNSTSLDQLALDLLFALESRASILPSLTGVEIKPSIEINLGVIKAKLAGSAKEAGRTPATVATQLVAGITEVAHAIRGIFSSPAINFMLDEVDRLPAEINFGHFMKVLHETIQRSSTAHVTFILAGQQGVYSRFYADDESFERIIRHVPLSTLDPDSAEYVIAYAATQADPGFVVEEEADDLVLALASGYPYVIHLLGDAAYRAMSDPEHMRKGDVLRGLEGVLASDKREKYIARLRSLPLQERRVLIKLAQCPARSLPVAVPVKWLTAHLDAHPDIQATLEETLRSLEERGAIRLRDNRKLVSFSEELFRVFIALGVIEQFELRLRRAHQDAAAEAKLALARDHEAKVALMEWDSVERLDEKTRREIIQWTRRAVGEPPIRVEDWRGDELSDIYDQYTAQTDDTLGHTSTEFPEDDPALEDSDDDLDGSR